MKKRCDDAMIFLKDFIQECDKGESYLKCKDYYEWYYTYGYVFSPKVIVEFGVRYGYSLISMCKGVLTKGRVNSENLWIYGVDKETWNQSNKIAKRNLSKIINKTHVRLFKSDTQNFDMELLKRHKHRIDLIHLDASHWCGQLLDEIKIAWSNLGRNKIMIIDDVKFKELGKYKDKTLPFDKVSRNVPYILYKWIGRQIILNKIKGFEYINNEKGNLIIHKN